MRQHSDGGGGVPEAVHMRVSYPNEKGRQGSLEDNPHYPRVTQDPKTKEDIQFPEEHGLIVPNEYAVFSFLGKLTASISSIFKLPL